MYCPRCSVAVDDSAKFCPQCGLNLNVPYVAEVEPETPESAMEIAKEEPKPQHSVKTLWQRLGIRNMDEQTIARFRLKGTAAALAAEMSLPTFEQSSASYFFTNGMYRYYASGTGDMLPFYILLAEEALDDPAGYEYHTAVDALLAVLPEQYHKDVDPSQKKLTARVVPKQLPTPDDALASLPAPDADALNYYSSRTLWFTLPDTAQIAELVVALSTGKDRKAYRAGKHRYIVAVRKHRYIISKGSSGGVSLDVHIVKGYREALTMEQQREEKRLLLHNAPEPYKTMLKGLGPW